ncbi:hypothetical protein JR316_0005075 [Psilocybe cubensis]|uniref:Uncharacterized protein n=2 Tax=Psilocybe cubensis TaxID=181762 RepID=A0A8H7Y217_PSICU|nr:hypothetical protein JR316_0005075 [Psilocybe cubensis]KAH9482975.1 hypothetical protein JR316_0005075 [Psilocybe cubensis]
MPSLFPPPLAPNIPEAPSLLVTGKYHPSAPIHLALSSHRAIVLSASRSDLVSDLQQFNDAFLNTESGKGSTSELSSRIEIFYPPSPAHLCLLLSLLRVANPEVDATEHTPVPQKTVQPIPPSTIVLHELSRYLWNEENANTSRSSWMLSSYLNLLNRLFLCISNLKKSPLDLPPSLVLFDSKLGQLKLLETNENVLCESLTVIERLFSCVAIFEEDSSYIPSSQSSERDTEEGLRKQVRYYCPHKTGPVEIQIDRWTEMTRDFIHGDRLPERWFKWEQQDP